MLEFQKGNDIVLQAELERREMMANQERRELAERQDLERRRREAEIVGSRAVDHAQCTWKGDHTAMRKFLKSLS